VIRNLAIVIFLAYLGLMFGQGLYQGYYASYYTDPDAPPEAF
jgi:hypothetical protein